MAVIIQPKAKNQYLLFTIFDNIIIDYYQALRRFTNPYYYLKNVVLQNGIILGVFQIGTIFTIFIISLYLFDGWFDDIKEIKTAYLNLFIGIAGVILAMLALFDDFGRVTRLTPQKSMILKLVLIVFSGNLAFVSNNKKDIQTNLQVQNERRATDSFSKKNSQMYQDTLRQRTKEITANFINALAENGKTYDVKQQKVIDMVRDSARKVSVKNEDEPDLSVDKILIDPNTPNNIDITFLLQKTKAKDINVEFYSIIESNGQFSFPPSQDRALITNGIFTANSRNTVSLILGSHSKIENIFLKLKGSYSDYRGNKISYEPILYYNFSDKSWGSLAGERYNTIVQKFASFGIK